MKMRMNETNLQYLNNVQIEIRPVKVGNKEYYTVNQLSSIISKSEQTIYHLINKGNAVRKMKSIKIGQTILVPCEELTEFPFTYAGRYSEDSIYHYDAKGRVIENGEK